jgi:hypothetical protein
VMAVLLGLLTIAEATSRGLRIEGDRAAVERLRRR